MTQDGWTVQYATREVKVDREIVRTVLAQSGRAVQYAAEELRADREIIVVAVTQNGCALCNAARECRADRYRARPSSSGTGWRAIMLCSLV